jgi:AraC family ethanolamine operon transcriptional activator
MNNNSGQPLLAPQIFRFSDVDQFRSLVRNLNVDFTPLVRTISAEQIILNLPGCSINLIKSFPRIVDAQLEPNCTAIAFVMDDGIPLRLYGVEWDRPFIAIGSNRAVYSAVEEGVRHYVLASFTPQVEDRGWPAAGPNFRVFETSPWAHNRLRALVREMLLVSSSPPDGGEPPAGSAMRESLFAAIDAAFADIVPAKWTMRANALRQFKIFQEVRGIVASGIGQPIYTSDLARQLGVSVRTIHDAVLRHTGMSLHRYLRLRRLWLVRRELRAGTKSVKAAALAAGFWHLGDFSHSYRVTFGETPSETLARAKGG